MYDIITIGDTTVDVFLTINESAALDCRLDQERCELILGYATKIPVSSMTQIVGGGNAANHAVGASRLGFKTAIYTHVGVDKNGRSIVSMFREARVGTRYVVYDRQKKTNYSTVLEYRDDRTILVFHEERAYALPSLPKTPWIYFSSISGKHEAFHKELVRHVKKHSIRLGFNPGTLQLKLGLKGLKPILQMTEVLFVNKEEAERLLGHEGKPKELLLGIAHHGPRIVVITDGQNGSYCFDGKDSYYLGIHDVPVVERTGCGDAYASGFVAARASGKSVQEAMRWGSFNAAGVIQKIGPHEGLLSKSRMEYFAKTYKEFQPTPL